MKLEEGNLIKRDASSLKVAIVASRYNQKVIDRLIVGAQETFYSFGGAKKNIVTEMVPGAFEIPLAISMLVKKDYDLIVAIGCVIKGETPHYDYIVRTVTDAIMDISLRCSKPIGYGVLATNNLREALERAGGSVGNKGVEAMQAAVEMKYVIDKYN